REPRALDARAGCDRGTRRGLLLRRHHALWRPGDASVNFSPYTVDFLTLACWVSANAPPAQGVPEVVPWNPPPTRNATVRSSAGGMDSVALVKVDVIPFHPGRRPTDEARSPGMGSSDQLAFVNAGVENRCYLLYHAQGAGEIAVNGVPVEPHAFVDGDL